jgi:hypothetical protein
MARKKRDVYGLNIHLLVTKDGQPLEGYLMPGSYSDVRGLKTLQCDLPAGSYVYADKASNDDEREDAWLAAVPLQ